jgi:predicted DNA-binding protein with PD1-like motif
VSFETRVTATNKSRVRLQSMDNDGAPGTLDEQVELLSLIGDVALKDGEHQVHAHAAVGKQDGTAHGGHLLQAHVRPTCELVVNREPSPF